MPPLTDRQIVELAVPPLLVRALVAEIESADGDDPAALQMCHEVRGELTVAVNEALRARLEHAAKNERRAYRVVRDTLDIPDYEHFATVILAIRLLIARLIEHGWIMLHESSAFDRAWSRLSAALEETDEAWALDRPERRGEADALERRLRKRLREAGYYVDTRQTAEVAA